MLHGMFLYLHCPYVSMLLIYVQFSRLHLIYVLISAITCMKYLNHFLHRTEHSRLVVPATTVVKQNVTTWLRVGTVCEYNFLYDKNLHLKNKAKASCVAD